MMTTWRRAMPALSRPPAARALLPVTGWIPTIKCYNEVDGLAKLSARQITKAAQNPRPTHSKGYVASVRAPLFHAFTRRVRREFYEAYHLFLAAFRDAADRLRAGHRTAKFPLGGFPPALPFISALARSGAPG